MTTTVLKQPPPKRLLRSSMLVSAMTMLSRVLGLVRDIIFARFIGAEANADAFFVAFKIPNFLRRLFAEGAFAQAFVPVLSEYRAKGSQIAVKNLIDRICGCLGLTLIGVTTLVVIISPVFTAFFGMGFLLNDPDKFWLTSDLLRITFPYLLLVSLTAFAGSILNSYDQFAVPAVTPIFLNISLIFSAVIASSWFEVPVMALAWGVLLAGVIQLLFQVPFLLRLGLMPHPKVDWSDESVRRVLRLMAPAMFGVSVSQINLLFDTILASFLPTGSVSWLFYSDRLVELPLGVFGVAIATVILPNLSRQNTGDGSHFNATLDWALKMVLLIALPSALALFVLAKPILFTLFQYEKTSIADMTMASYSLRAYALGLGAFMLIKILASAFFARQDTRSPVRIGIIAMIVNMVLNLLFVLPLHYFLKLGHVGLALATACSACLNAFLLYRSLRAKAVYKPQIGWMKFYLRLSLACLVMLVGLLFLSLYLPDFALLSWAERSRYLAIYVSVGIVSYICTLILFGMRIGDLRLQAPLAQ